MNSDDGLRSLTLLNKLYVDQILLILTSFSLRELRLISEFDYASSLSRIPLLSWAPASFDLNSSSHSGDPSSLQALNTSSLRAELQIPSDPKINSLLTEFQLPLSWTPAPSELNSSSLWAALQIPLSLIPASPGLNSSSLWAKLKLTLCRTPAPSELNSSSLMSLTPSPSEQNSSSVYSSSSL
jgi:hypothetical protein